MSLSTQTILFELQREALVNTVRMACVDICLAMSFGKLGVGSGKMN